jgi:hypothetical protein
VTVPTPVPPHLQHWVRAFEGGDHYDAVYDRAAADSVMARNRTAGTVLTVVGAASLLLCLVLLVAGGPLTRLVILLGIFGLVATFLTLPTILNVRRGMRRLGAGEGTLARVSSVGVSFGLVGPIAWDEITGVIEYDATARADAVARIPLIGWGARASRRAGNGRRGLTLALRDGSAVQARIRDENERGFVRLWGPKSSSSRPGDIAVIIDSLLDDTGVRQLIEATVVGALMNGVPVYHPRSAADYLQTLGRLVDPTFPTA